MQKLNLRALWPVHLLILTALLASLTGGLPVWAQTPVEAQLPPVQLIAGPPVDNPLNIPAPSASRLSAPQTSVNIIYINSWPADAQAAFSYAANIWGSLLNSNVPITIRATWASLSPGVLGSAGPATFYRNISGQPIANTYYPVALANALSGSDLNGATHEINATFNSNFSSWHFDTSSVPPSGKYDFATVVLHEFGHGLGFIGSMSVSSGIGTYNLGGYPVIYDRFTEDGSGTPLLSYPNNSAQLAGALTNNNIYFDATYASAINGGRVPLYAPSSWNGGSSYSHLDEDFNGTPHALMTYSLSPRERIHDPGALILAMFRDMGWSVNSGSTPTATPVTPTATPVTPTATPVTPTATPVTPTATVPPFTPVGIQYLPGLFKNYP